jgi:hypothetical protein
MKNYLVSSFISKIAANGECALPALEVPRPFFAQGYISACGDALLVVPEVEATVGNEPVGVRVGPKGGRVERYFGVGEDGFRERGRGLGFFILGCVQFVGIAAMMGW